eukprot:scaffold54626_cov36-Phaeocystis_antarctica.AAC.1
MLRAPFRSSGLSRLLTTIAASGTSGSPAALVLPRAYSAHLGGSSDGHGELSELLPLNCKPHRAHRRVVIKRFTRRTETMQNLGEIKSPSGKNAGLCRQRSTRS